MLIGGRRRLCWSTSIPVFSLCQNLCKDVFDLREVKRTQDEMTRRDEEEGEGVQKGPAPRTYE